MQYFCKNTTRQLRISLFLFCMTRGKLNKHTREAAYNEAGSVFDWAQRHLFSLSSVALWARKLLFIAANLEVFQLLK